MRCFCLIALALGLPAVPANADSAQASAASRTARSILAREHCQTEMPTPAARSHGQGLPSTGLSHPDAAPIQLPPLPILGELLPTLAIAAIVVCLVVTLALLVKRVTWDAEPGHPARSAAGASPPAAREQALPDHERLAQAGRFSDAIHALLLRALRQLARSRAADAAATSLTSREILRSAALSSNTRQALAPLVDAVERVYFGGGGAGMDEYAACVVHSRRFEAACRADL